MMYHLELQSEEDPNTILKNIFSYQIHKILSSEKLDELCQTIDKKVKQDINNQLEFIKKYRKEGNKNFVMPTTTSDISNTINEMYNYDIESQNEISKINNKSKLAQLVYKALKKHSNKTEYLKLGMSNKDITKFFLKKKEFNFIKSFIYNNSSTTKVLTKQLITSLEKLDNDINNQHNFQKELHEKLKIHKLLICQEIDSIISCSIKCEDFTTYINKQWISGINSLLYST